ncbi:helix-turn-helix domain-containing protein [Lactococcus garvieae]|nr:helix-turn-helix domain-containing protein [Lactococcus garvieae]
MTTFDRIKELADRQGKSLQKVASDLGFSPNYFYNLKSKKSPSAEHLAKVADYFHVSVDYLLGREGNEGNKEPIDLADLVDESKVDWDEWVSFDGKPLTDEVKTALKLILGKRLED